MRKKKPAPNVLYFTVNSGQSGSHMPPMYLRRSRRYRLGHYLGRMRKCAADN